MKLQRTAALPLVAALLVSPLIARAQTVSTEVPAVVEFTHALDSKNLSVGANVQARLTETVKFADGTKLPKGTWLDASVATDDMQVDGSIKLALRFTDARLKDGKTLPVKATIVAVATHSTPVQNNPSMLEVVMPVPASLDANVADGVVDPNVASGVDLHSKASSQNSGVFVSTTKEDVKLPTGTKMELALALGM